MISCLRFAHTTEPQCTDWHTDTFTDTCTHRLIHACTDTHTDKCTDTHDNMCAGMCILTHTLQSVLTCILTHTYSHMPINTCTGTHTNMCWQLTSQQMSDLLQTCSDVEDWSRLNDLDSFSSFWPWLSLWWNDGSLVQGLGALCAWNSSLAHIVLVRDCALVIAACTEYVQRGRE